MHQAYKQAMLKARRKRSKLSMTSLIDVIFLLLLFFMLTSTFTKFAEVELLSATSGGNGDLVKTPPLFMRLGADTLTLNAQPAKLDTLAGMMKSQRNTETSQPVLISLSADTSAQRLTDLLMVLRTLPGLAISVLESKT
jgi:biopolymer transport protein ExbD